MNENRQLVVVQAFVAQLYQAGVRDICISPGSRSTPLTMAFVRHGGFSLWSVLDERSSGFFAVGLARRKSQPIVLVCTSGTATGNYLPAVMEAHNARLPVLVVTADRPPELYDTGANQTIYQRNLYGALVKWHHEMPVPEDTVPLTRHAVAAAARAVISATSVPAGPVHINWPFREPLIPPGEPFELPDAGAHVSGIQTWGAETGLSPDSVARLRRQLQEYKQGLIVCGPSFNEDWTDAVITLAEDLGWPILADPMSQLRAGGHSKSNVITTYDTLMRSAWFRQIAKPDVVLRFGAAMTSKVCGQFLTEAADARQIVVDAADVWIDSVLTATDVIHVNPRVFCEQLTQSTQTLAEDVYAASVAIRSEAKGSAWLSWWQQANEAAASQLSQRAAAAPWYEGQLIPEILSALPDDVSVFVGNSMPIRDFDTFMTPVSKRMRLFSNRGVSGIDGVVSSALGVAAAGAEPTLLIIGDVSFYHDLNALLIAKRHELDLLVVVVNNDGGGIFSFLPQAEHDDTFAHFRTAHGLQFSPAADLYGAEHQVARDWSEFRDIFHLLIGKAGLRILELSFDSAENLQHHRVLFENVTQAVKELSRSEDVQWKL